MKDETYLWIIQSATHDRAKLLAHRGHQTAFNLFAGGGGGHPTAPAGGIWVNPPAFPDAT
jgi:hypothetical protein